MGCDVRGCRISVYQCYMVARVQIPVLLTHLNRIYMSRLRVVRLAVLCNHGNHNIMSGWDLGLFYIIHLNQLQLNTNYTKFGNMKRG